MISAIRILAVWLLLCGLCLADSYDFDGSNDYVAVSSVDLLGSSDDITISLWINPDATQNAYANIIDHDHSDIGGANNWVIQQNDSTNNQFYWAFTYDGTNYDGTSKTTTLTSDVWQHFVIVKNGTDLDHYIDGVKQGSTLTVQANITTGTTPLHIGDYVQASGRQFDGHLDDVRIYDRALSVGEITADQFGMNQVPNAVGHWLFQGNATDISGGNDGTVNGATVSSESSPTTWFSFSGGN